MNDRVICPSCGHTTKAGLVNEDGLCPVCAGKANDEAESSEEED